MLKIEVIKFEAMDVITASVPTPPADNGEPDYPKELDNCVCPQFKCGPDETGSFSHKNGCNCTTNAHWVTEE